MAPENASDEAKWVETWKEYASALDRVKSVTMTLSEPQPVSWIAAEAAVSPNIARNYLDRLIDLGVVMVTELNETRHYYPDPLYTRLRDVREILQETTKREPSEQAAELKRTLRSRKMSTTLAPRTRCVNERLQKMSPPNSRTISYRLRATGNLLAIGSRWCRTRLRTTTRGRPTRH